MLHGHSHHKDPELELFPHHNLSQQTGSRTVCGDTHTKQMLGTDHYTLVRGGGLGVGSERFMSMIIFFKNGVMFLLALKNLRPFPIFQHFMLPNISITHITQC